MPSPGRIVDEVEESRGLVYVRFVALWRPVASVSFPSHVIVVNGLASRQIVYLFIPYTTERPRSHLDTDQS